MLTLIGLIARGSALAFHYSSLLLTIGLCYYRTKPRIEESNSKVRRKQRRYTLLLVGPPLHSFSRETADARQGLLCYTASAASGLSARRYTLLLVGPPLHSFG
ncbi:hypothetical protein BHE74_00051108 [Ensete ventricosum]|nr:hypothetical protein BHE74_00051108 [Ensete ventricosum]